MLMQREQLLTLLGKQVHVVIDRPIGYRHGSLVYPVNYGYIPGMLAGDGEEQDAYVLGVQEPLSAFDGQVIGIVTRKNDREDKLIVAPEGTVLHQGQIAAAVHFQEQYFDSETISIFQKSCGVLPYRTVGDQREYLIVFEQFSHCWSLPKGHMEPGETEPQTALRELLEETALQATLDTTRKASVEYSLSSVVRKQVVYFSGHVSGTPVPRAGEIRQLCWVTADKLKDYLHPDTVNAIASLL